MTNDAERLLQLLPLAIARQDGADGFLAGMLEPVAQWQRWSEEKRARTRTLIDPNTVPDAIVRALASNVGLGADLPQAYLLTVDELRRLIPVAVALWRTKGTATSWRQVIAYLAQSRALILGFDDLSIDGGDAFYLTLSPAPGTSVDEGAYDYPETVSDVWLSPYGAVDVEGVLVPWLDLCRPLNERINLYVCAFLEDLRLGVDLWSVQTPGGGDGYTAAAAFDGLPEIVSSGGNVFMSRADLLELDGVNGYRVQVLARSPSTWSAYLFAQDADGDDCYRVTVNVSTFGVAFHRVEAGVATLLASVTLPEPITEWPYLWDFDAHVLTGAAGVELVAYWSGVQVLSAVDASPPWVDGLAGFAGGGEVGVRSFMVYRHGPARIRVGPTP